MSHRYRVLKSTSMPGTYAATGADLWTPYCACGWVGTEGPQGPRPAAARTTEFLDHLRDLEAEPTIDRVELDELRAQITKAFEAIRPLRRILTDPQEEE